MRDRPSDVCVTGRVASSCLHRFRSSPWTPWMLLMPLAVRQAVFCAARSESASRAVGDTRRAGRSGRATLGPAWGLGEAGEVRTPLCCALRHTRCTVWSSLSLGAQQGSLRLTSSLSLRVTTRPARTDRVTQSGHWQASRAQMAGTRARNLCHGAAAALGCLQALPVTA
jgi:hypothetical protein